LFIILKFVLGFTDFSFSEFSSLAAPASARFLAFFGALLDGWDGMRSKVESRESAQAHL